jgi:hypothetical protein
MKSGTAAAGDANSAGRHAARRGSAPVPPVAD